MEDKENDIAIVVGALIREFRLEKNYSQEKLAELSSLDMTYISMIESGKRNITLKSLLKICTALNVKLTDFAKTLESRLTT